MPGEVHAQPLMAQAIHAHPTVGMGLQQTASQLFPIGRALVGPDEHETKPTA